MWSLISDGYRLIRFSALGASMLLPLLGAASALPRGQVVPLAALLLGGFALHCAIYLLNDIVDLEVDRLAPMRRDYPLVRGALTVPTLLALAALMAALALTVAWRTGGFEWMLAALLLLAAYDLWGKRCPWPPVPEALQGLGWGALLAWGALVAGTPTPLTLALVAYEFALIMLVNGVHGGLRDLASDAQAGARTTALWLGVRAAPDGSLHLSRLFIAWALSWQTMLFVALGAALALAGYSPSIQLLVGLGLLLLLAPVAGALRDVQQGARKEALIALGMLHLIAILSAPLVVVLPQMAANLVVAALLVHLLPLLANGMTYQALASLRPRVWRLAEQATVAALDLPPGLPPDLARPRPPQLLASAPIAVIGAGVAGLAAAQRLRAAGKTVRVFEANPQIGGRVQSEQIEGFTIDTGAEFIASFYKATLASLSPATRAELVAIPSRAAFWRAGRLHLVRANPSALATRLLSPGSWWRLARLAVHARLQLPAPSLRAFWQLAPADTQPISADTALDDEARNYLVEPLLRGIFYWRAQQTSAAMVRMLLRAALDTPFGLRLFGLRHGMAALPRDLARDLSIETNATIVALRRSTAGFVLTVRGADGTHREELCSAVVCAIPAPQAAQLCTELAPRTAAWLSETAYSCNITVALAYAGRLPQQAYSLLFPCHESPILASATIQSVKSSTLAPPDCSLLTLHLSSEAARAHMDRPDAAIIELALAALRELAPAYDPAEQLRFARVYRWPLALPLFDPAHMRRLAQFAAAAPEVPGLVLAGDYLGGPYIEGALAAGVAAAERLLGLD